MFEQDTSNDLMDWCFAFLVVVAVVALFVWRASYGAELPRVPEIPGAPYGCAWIDCHQDSQGKMSCVGPLKGTTEDLVRVIQNNSNGAVSYDCGPGKGERK